MRLGKNPAKEISKLPEYGLHRIIIPVYIPELTGYFEHSLEILRLCIGSLIHTITDQDAVTIVANGCADEVIQVLLDYYHQSYVDQLIIHEVNRGKIDAILSAARGAYEPFITFVDSDGFFYPGWQRAAANIFSTFPSTGWVSLFPAPDPTWLNTASTIFYAFWRGFLRKKPVVASAELRRFGESIGRPNMYNQKNKTHYLCINKIGVNAIVGGGHFAFTIRKEILSYIPNTPSCKFIAEEEYMGIPFDHAGFWRLSTPQLYVQHMGNIPEEWMYSEFAKYQSGDAGAGLVDWPSGRILPDKSVVPYTIRNVFFRIAKKCNLIKFLPAIEDSSHE